jgi:hypothetical protein
VGGGCGTNTGGGVMIADQVFFPKSIRQQDNDHQSLSFPHPRMTLFWKPFFQECGDVCWGHPSSAGWVAPIYDFRLCDEYKQHHEFAHLHLESGFPTFPITFTRPLFRNNLNLEFHHPPLSHMVYF